MNQNQVNIEVVDQEKDFRINFSSTLSFDHHSSAVVIKVNSYIGLLRRNISYLDKVTFLLLYKGLIWPLTYHGIIIYYPVTKKNKRMIENTQRRTTRLVPDLNDWKYTKESH